MKRRAGMDPATPLELTAFRNRRGWTWKQAAEWYGCNWRTWARWERGESPAPRGIRVLMENERTPEIS